MMITLALLGLAGIGSATAATTPPRNTSLPTIAGTPQQGQNLKASPGTWSGTPPISFSYQWSRCNPKGASCSDIAGATKTTYTAMSADVANTLRVRVRATNSAGSSSATSAATALVAGPKTISLNTSPSTALYGQAVMLNGVVANGQAGESVTIIEHRVPPVGGIETHALATVRTGSDGSFSLSVHPFIHTLYKATTAQTSSDEVSVSVTPRLRLKAIARHRYVVRALAARSFVGKFGLLQHWSRLRHRWVRVRMVFFRSAVVGIAPSTTSRAVFRIRLAGRLRIVMPRSQTAPGYLPAVSNRVIA